MVTDCELYFQCGDETGRAGASDDSIYSDDGRGPWCLSCYNAADPDRDEGVTGPTLGTRILDAVTAWSIAVQDQSEAIDGDSWEDSYDASVNEGMATLRALATRADAAERLAKAVNIYADDEDEYWRSGGEPFELEQMANEEHVAALAAWRAIEGEVTG